MIVAFAILGLGMATVVPLTFSAAGRTPGHDPGTSVAAVATVGYGGWMLAPPVIGFVAQGTSLTFSLALVAVITALIAVPAGASAGPRLRLTHQARMIFSVGSGARRAGI